MTYATDARQANKLIDDFIAAYDHGRHMDLVGDREQLDAARKKLEQARQALFDAIIG